VNGVSGGGGGDGAAESKSRTHAQAWQQQVAKLLKTHCMCDKCDP